MGLLSSSLSSSLQSSLITWHACVVDFDPCGDEGILVTSYTSDETTCNIAYVNTHAQLEAMRDEAASAIAKAAAADNNTNVDSGSLDGPRVLVCGPTEIGKSSLVRLLAAYACKLGRMPVVVDLDPADNRLSIGTRTPTR
jgi:polyribonucleotide 5'-hydroxyl-kinase